MKLRIDPNGSNIQIDAEEPTPMLVSGRFDKTHTGVGTWEARITEDHTLTSNAESLDEIFLEKDDGTLLFRGFLFGVETDRDAAETTLSGEGLAYTLTNTDVSVRYQNRLAHNAIADYWSNQTNFTATVTTPTARASVTDNVAQSADTNAEFNSITTIADTTPLAVQNGNLELLQAGFFTEAESATNSFVLTTETDADASDGERVDLNDADNPHFVERDFTTNYDIPDSRQLWAARFKNEDSSEVPGIAVKIDEGQTGTFTTIFDVGENWNNNTGYYWENRQNGLGETLEAGSHTFRVEIFEETTNTKEIYCDAFWFGDDEYSWTFDNSVDTDGFLSGPELYPDAETFAFDQETTPWNITEGSISSTWNDTSNNQKIQLQLSGQTWLPNDGTEDNTSSITTDFGADFGTNIRGRATLSRFGSRTTDSPTSGFNGQTIQDWEITYDGNDLAIIEDQTFQGTHFQNLQDLHDFADMRFTILHKANSLEAESYRAGDVSKTLPSVITSGTGINNKIPKTDATDYANKVVVRSKEVAGTRFVTTIQDDQEVANKGEQVFSVIQPSIETQADTDAKARSLLAQKLRELDKKGTLETAPVDIAPGFSYANQFEGQSGDIPLEEVQYQIQNQQLTGNLRFDFRVSQIPNVLGGLQRDVRNAGRGI